MLLCFRIIQNEPGRGEKIVSHSVGRILICILSISGVNENAFASGAVTAFNIGVFVSNKVRASQINRVILGRLLDHARRRFAATTRLIRTMWTDVRGID
jgi:hypothetical protein